MSVEGDADRWWREPLAAVVAGRKVILAGGVAAGWTALVPVVRRLGATDVLVVPTEGTGAGPQPEDATVMVCEPPPEVVGMMPRLRASLALLGDLPTDVVTAIESFDPDRAAAVFAVFLSEAAVIAGRPAIAYRRPEWVALEDKTVVDALLDRAGVARAPSAVVTVGDAFTAHRRLDQGAGTVWAADARDGYHGGATATRWVVDDATAAAATAELALLGDRVRVMPFLEGIATSVHGIVLPEGVAVLRPVELVTLRRGHELVYAGCATYWDPPNAVREEMRAAARHVGEQLRHDVDFRGAFTLDGVATTEGFRPTEVNPRFGAGLNVVARTLADVPLLLVLDVVVAGGKLGITAADLEAWLVAEADTTRAGGTWRIGVPVTAPIDSRSAVYDNGSWHWAADGEVPDATVVARDKFARAAFEPVRTPAGPSVGPRAAAFWNWYESAEDYSGAPLTAALDVTAP